MKTRVHSCCGAPAIKLLQRPLFLLGVLAFLLTSGACDSGETDTSRNPDDLSGTIVGGGSTTVFPITAAVAKDFDALHPDVHVVIGLLSTGTIGGFDGFCSGQTDFSNASRLMNDDEEALCAENGVEYTVLQVAYDGLSILVHPSSDFVSCLTVEDLRAIWEPASSIDNWGEVRAGFPDRPLTLYGPGVSGTHDYFTLEVVGEEGSSRHDYYSSENEDRLVERVADDETALGYFGFGYYERNRDKLRVLAVDSGGGCVAPTPETILDGTYSPLSRPLFVYVLDRALERPEVAEFMRFYMTKAPEILDGLGFVPAEDKVYADGLELLP